MELEIGYGTGVQRVEIAPQNLSEIILPNKISAVKSEAEIVKEALDHPIGTERLEDIARKTFIGRLWQSICRLFSPVM